VITKQDISISKFHIYAFHDWWNSYTNTAKKKQNKKKQKKKTAFEADFNTLHLKTAWQLLKFSCSFLEVWFISLLFVILLEEFLRARFRCRKIEKEILANKLKTLSTACLNLYNMLMASFNRNKISLPCRVKFRRFLSSPRKNQTKS